MKEKRNKRYNWNNWTGGSQKAEQLKMAAMVAPMSGGINRGVKPEVTDLTREYRETRGRPKFDHEYKPT